eukprot:TRINITY_DN3272_c0_g1_i3.p1 TRINITY_DN3272_c0_g1~~TRINITY_DN3272_c0_g1_i3.p1  ORF type:complete len:1513 (-),score=242.72 TRINITY_DN3272_c0_g1_i3:213-4751(-)
MSVSPPCVFVWDEHDVWPLVEQTVYHSLPLKDIERRIRIDQTNTLLQTFRIDSLQLSFNLLHPDDRAPASQRYLWPYLHLYLVHCQVQSEDVSAIRKRILSWRERIREREFLIVLVNATNSMPPHSSKQLKTPRIFRTGSVHEQLERGITKLEKALREHFRHRVVRVNGTDCTELMRGIAEGVLSTLEGRVQSYSKDSHQSLEKRAHDPGAWNYCEYFLAQEGLATMYMQFKQIPTASHTLASTYNSLAHHLEGNLASFPAFSTKEELTALRNSTGTMFRLTPATNQDYRARLASNKISELSFRIYLFARQTELFFLLKQHTRAIHSFETWMTLIVNRIARIEGVTPFDVALFEVAACISLVKEVERSFMADDEREVSEIWKVPAEAEGAATSKVRGAGATQDEFPHMTNEAQLTRHDSDESIGEMTGAESVVVPDGELESTGTESPTPMDSPSPGMDYHATPEGGELPTTTTRPATPTERGSALRSTSITEPTSVNSGTSPDPPSAASAPVTTNSEELDVLVAELLCTARNRLMTAAQLKGIKMSRITTHPLVNAPFTIPASATAPLCVVDNTPSTAEEPTSQSSQAILEEQYEHLTQGAVEYLARGNRQRCQLRMQFELARLYMNQDRYADARPLLLRLVHELEALGWSEMLYTCRLLSADCLWKLLRNRKPDSVSEKTQLLITQYTYSCAWLSSFGPFSSLLVDSVRLVPTYLPGDPQDCSPWTARLPHVQTEKQARAHFWERLEASIPSDTTVNLQLLPLVFVRDLRFVSNDNASLTTTLKLYSRIPKAVTVSRAVIWLMPVDKNLAPYHVPRPAPVQHDVAIVVTDTPPGGASNDAITPPLSPLSPPSEIAKLRSVDLSTPVDFELVDVPAPATAVTGAAASGGAAATPAPAAYPQATLGIPVGPPAPDRLTRRVSQRLPLQWEVSTHHGPDELFLSSASLQAEMDDLKHNSLAFPADRAVAATTSAPVVLHPDSCTEVVLRGYSKKTGEYFAAGLELTLELPQQVQKPGAKPPRLVLCEPFVAPECEEEEWTRDTKVDLGIISSRRPWIAPVPPSGSTALAFPATLSRREIPSFVHPCSLPARRRVKLLGPRQSSMHVILDPPVFGEDQHYLWVHLVTSEKPPPASIALSLNLLEGDDGPEDQVPSAVTEWSTGVSLKVLDVTAEEPYARARRAPVVGTAKATPRGCNLDISQITVPQSVERYCIAVQLRVLDSYYGSRLNLAAQLALAGGVQVITTTTPPVPSHDTTFVFASSVRAPPGNLLFVNCVATLDHDTPIRVLRAALHPSAPSLFEAVELRKPKELESRTLHRGDSIAFVGTVRRVCPREALVEQEYSCAVEMIYARVFADGTVGDKHHTQHFAVWRPELFSNSAAAYKVDAKITPGNDGTCQPGLAYPLTISIASQLAAHQMPATSHTVVVEVSLDANRWFAIGSAQPRVQLDENGTGQTQVHLIGLAPGVIPLPKIHLKRVAPDSQTVGAEVPALITYTPQQVTIGAATTRAPEGRG